MADEETVTYRATSAYTDWTNVLATVQLIVSGMLMTPDVVAVIPLKWMPLIMAASSALTIVVRTVTAVRPVSMSVKPGESKPVQVKKLK